MTPAPGTASGTVQNRGFAGWGVRRRTQRWHVDGFDLNSFDKATGEIEMPLNATEGRYNTTAALRGEQKFAIPKAKLVGFGRAQGIQYICPCCKSPHFPGDPMDPRCSYCERKNAQLPDSVERSEVFFVEMVGWDQRIAAHRKRSMFNYRKVMIRDEYTCQYCGYSPTYCQQFLPLHVDHIHPFCTGGSNRMDNLAVACAKCNVIAGGRVFDDFESKRAFLLAERKKRNLPTTANEWRERGRSATEQEG